MTPGRAGAEASAARAGRTRARAARWRARAPSLHPSSARYVTMRAQAGQPARVAASSSCERSAGLVRRDRHRCSRARRRLPRRTPSIRAWTTVTGRRTQRGTSRPRATALCASSSKCPTGLGTPLRPPPRADPWPQEGGPSCAPAAVAAASRAGSPHATRCPAPPRLRAQLGPAAFRALGDPRLRAQLAAPLGPAPPVRKVVGARAARAAARIARRLAGAAQLDQREAGQGDAHLAGAAELALLSCAIQMGSMIET